MISIEPQKPQLVITALPSYNVHPVAPKKPLSLDRVESTSIPPRTIYHPAIINACKSMHGKHPSELDPDEAHKFNFYKEYKIKNGEPIEEDLIYLPCGGLKNCLHCGQLT